ncbi:AAA family ATPase [Photobacterium chitinilyticum]|uniref:ATP-binding protein n=1 Tax=Photobacterium chitinilyticum TaxID=2485123 RepID=A0A444JJ99_9GAMM|nr:AAA family ATPase [Photobacterium chitinilyticum]RWX53140.1 ATP-binding protein [Photobacterium chitinilyticum]
MAITFELYTGDSSGVPSPSQKPNTAYLKANNWDDYGFKTLFALVVFDSSGVRHDVGSIKIGCKEHKAGWISKLIDSRFKSLDEHFFSLGQDEEYYSNIQSLDPELRKNLLSSLRDIVSDENIYSIAIEEDVFKTSLLREVSLTSVSGQFKRILQGGSIRTEFHFKYEIPQGKRVAGLALEFHVDPESNPPSNVHVLIGRNGVGKTHLLNNMVKALVADDESAKKVGFFSIPLDDDGIPYSLESTEQLFSGVVSVAFSAFDPFEPYPEKKDKSQGVRYSYIGLKRSTNRGGERGTPMSRDMLTNEFVKSIVSSISKGNFERWLEAIKSLESDSLFRDLALSREFVEYTGDELEAFAKRTFNRMSSGHAIVLLTITKLVEKVEEKTLVLLDEPEAHLHPPLLSAFVRALSDLLSHRNGVAIVATHSPVILQEVPRECVYKMSRSGLKAKPERPLIETFGENVGVLTREIFGLEVSNSGYHKLIEKELEKSKSYKRILREFDGQLGSEAKGILRSLILAMKNEINE